MTQDNTRYSVVYDDLVAKWAVVDNRGAGLVIGFHEREDAAVNAARNEESSWPDLYEQPA